MRIFNFTKSKFSIQKSQFSHHPTVYNYYFAKDEFACACLQLEMCSALINESFAYVHDQISGEDFLFIPQTEDDLNKIKIGAEINGIKIQALTWYSIISTAKPRSQLLEHPDIANQEVEPPKTEPKKENKETKSSSHDTTSKEQLNKWALENRDHDFFNAKYSNGESIVSDIVQMVNNAIKEHKRFEFPGKNVSEALYNLISDLTHNTFFLSPRTSIAFFEMILKSTPYETSGGLVSEAKSQPKGESKGDAKEVVVQRMGPSSKAKKVAGAYTELNECLKLSQPSIVIRGAFVAFRNFLQEEKNTTLALDELKEISEEKGFFDDAQKIELYKLAERKAIEENTSLTIGINGKIARESNNTQHPSWQIVIRDLVTSAINIVRAKIGLRGLEKEDGAKKLDKKLTVLNNFLAVVNRLPFSLDTIKIEYSTKVKKALNALDNLVKRFFTDCNTADQLAVLEKLPTEKPAPKSVAVASAPKLGSG